MKFIRQYRTTSKGEYFYEFEITGTCTDNDLSALSLIATTEGRIPIEETCFFELWNFAIFFEMKLEITTKFEYRRMTRSKTGIFILAITEVVSDDATTLALKFNDYIEREY